MIASKQLVRRNNSIFVSMWGLRLAAASGVVLIRITRGPFSRRGGLNIRRQVTSSPVFLHKRQSAAPARDRARTGKVNVYTTRLVNVIR